MDINDVENRLNDAPFSASKEKVLEELIYLAIQNNSMIRVLLENQSKINAIIDSSKTQSEHRDELLKMYSDADLEKFTSIMSRISDK
jgi:hypothetical protein